MYNDGTYKLTFQLFKTFLECNTSTRWEVTITANVIFIAHKNLNFKKNIYLDILYTINF